MMPLGILLMIVIMQQVCGYGHKQVYILLYTSFVDHDHGIEPKIMCFMDNLIELIGNQCRFCSLKCKVSTRVVGCTLVVNMLCNTGHTFSWASSPVLINHNNSTIYKGNLAFALALLLSGNYFNKILQLFHFLGLKCISTSTYYAYQRLVLCPAIQKFYNNAMVSQNTFLCAKVK